MPFLKQKTGSKDNFILNSYEKMDNCCNETGLKTCSVTFTTSGNTIDKIVIDGTEYTFTTDGTTNATIKAGIREAFTAAGYDEVQKAGVSVTTSGSNTVVKIYTTAVIEKLITTTPTDLAVTCA